MSSWHGQGQLYLCGKQKKKAVLYIDMVSITVNVFLTNKTNWYVHQAVGKCKSCNALGHAEVNIKYFDMATILLLV